MFGFLKFKDNIEKIFFFLFLIPVAMMLYGRFASLFEFEITIWSVRDFSRTLNLLNEFQVSGAEMSFGSGMRIPGGALYYLWFLPVFLTQSPSVLYAFMQVLDLFAAGIFFFVLNRSMGLLAAVFGLCVYLSAFVTNCVMIQLWNPGFMSVFVFGAICFLQRALCGEWKYFKYFLLVCALGIQVHLSVALLIVPALCVVFIVVPQNSRKPFVIRGLFPGCVLFVLAFAPYLVVELVNGFPNTGLALRQYFFRSYSGTLIERTEIFARELGLLLGGVKPFVLRQGSTQTFGFEFLGQYLLLVSGFIGAVFATLHAKKRSPVSGLVLFALLLVFQTVLLYYFFSSTLELYPRYLFIIVPGLSILSAYALWVLQSSRWLRTVVNATVLCGMLVCSGVSMQFKPVAAFNSASLENCFQNVKKHTGWTSLELASKTTVLVKSNVSGSLKWERDFDMACMSGFALSREGLEFPGSGKFSGAVVFLGGAGDSELADINPQSLARKYLLCSVDDLEIKERVQLGKDLLIVYSRPKGLAFTNMSNKYIALREEKTIKRYVAGLESNSSVFVPEAKGYVINLNDVAFALLRVNPQSDGGVDVELFSNQLRGYTHNNGLFNDATIQTPVLVWEEISTGKIVETVIYDGLVGLGGVFAPLKRHVAVPQGRYRLSLRVDVFELVDKYLEKPVIEYAPNAQAVRIVLGNLEV